MTPRTPTRREFVAGTAGATVSISGCLFPGTSSSEPESVDVSVSNDDAEAHTVAVTVTDESGTTVIDRSVTVEPRGTVGVGTVEPGADGEEITYTLDAELDEDATETLEFGVGGASGTLFVRIEIEGDGDFRIRHVRE